MALVHVATASTVRAELADAEDDFDTLQRELARAQKEVADVRRSGAAVLAAVEAAMAPTMAQLAAARRSCGDDEKLASLGCLEDEGRTGGSPCEALEAEIRHLELDIAHYQEQVAQLQAEERRSAHELGRARSELSEVSEQLAYERHSVRHYQICQQLGLEMGGAGAGNPGIGRRTLEVKAETELRECAEQRTGRLVRHVTRLAGDTAAQQSTIDQLSRRLNRVRQSVVEKDRQISRASSAAADLHAKLTKPHPGAATREGAEEAEAEATDADETHRPPDESPDDGGPAGVDATPEKPSSADASATGGSLRADRSRAGKPPGKLKASRTSKSTGRLPQLSF